MEENRERKRERGGRIAGEGELNVCKLNVLRLYLARDFKGARGSVSHVFLPRRNTVE